MGQLKKKRKSLCYLSIDPDNSKRDITEIEVVIRLSDNFMPVSMSEITLAVCIAVEKAHPQVEWLRLLV